MGKLRSKYRLGPTLGHIGMSETWQKTQAVRKWTEVKTQQNNRRYKAQQ